MISMYPGKRCNKKVGDMTVKEYKQNDIYHKAARIHRKTHGPFTGVNKYPGKHIDKKVADMTVEELELNRLYTRASAAAYTKKVKGDPKLQAARKKCSKKYRDTHREVIKARNAIANATRVRDPVRVKASRIQEKHKRVQDRVTLNSSYIKRLIVKNRGIPMSLISEDMVSICTAEVAIKRVIKNLNNEAVI